MDLFSRLSRVDAASLCDAGPTLRVLPAELRPLTTGARLVGRALTADAGEDLMAVLGALHQGGPGDVLVVATGGSRLAVAGELFATEALRRGMAGVVIDGFCRDLSTLSGLPLPIFVRGACPRAAPARSVPRVQVPVHIADVVVSPGDIVVGDDDGVVTGTEAEFAAAVVGAEAIHRREEALRAAMLDGVSLFHRLDFVEHAGRLAAGEPSSLTFDA